VAAACGRRLDHRQVDDEREVAVNKVLFGLILGGVLGIFDGLTALFSAPETAPQIAGIVIGSTVKGLVAGAIIGFFARKVRSLPLGLLFGLAVGALFAWLVVYLGGGLYFWEIVVPGAIVGLIVGYATQRYGGGERAPGAATVGCLLALVLAAPALGDHHGHAHGAKVEAASVDAAAALARLKGLAGRWEGTAAGQPGGVVEYRVTGGGNVVMETMFPGTEHEMVSMYHLEGGELVMTHYCTSGNHPRLKLTAADAGGLAFGYAGGSLDPAKDVHVHAGRLGFAEDGVLEATWTFWKNGADNGAAAFVLKRAE
jgi:hypothetical protein